MFFNENYVRMRKIINNYLNGSEDINTLMRIKEEIKALHMNGFISSDEESNLLMMLPSLNKEIDELPSNSQIIDENDVSSFSSFANAAGDIKSQYNDDSFVVEKEKKSEGFGSLFDKMDRPPSKFYNSDDD